MKHVSSVALAILVAQPTATRAQTSPFLPNGVHRALVNEISGDRAFEHVRALTAYHRTGPGRDFWEAVEYIRSAAEEAGLDDVEVIRQDWDGHPWSCRSAEAWLSVPDPMKIADFHEVAVSVADMSRTTHVTADLVDVGEGATTADYDGLDVKGRIVLASSGPGTVMREAVWKRGALGVVSYASNRLQPFDAPDQVAWTRIPWEAQDVAGVEDGTPGTFAIMVSPRRGHWIRERLATVGAPLEIRVDIETDISAKGEQGMVEAWIRGSEIHDQQIVLISHIQEEKTSANDDGSGCASMLEIGRALARLVREGTLPRPRRDIRFWWVNELSSQPQYFRDHPEAPGQMLLALNQDMVGARQSWGGRVQYAARLPWSLPHALDDVMESVLEALRDGNTSYLVNRGTGQPQPFLKEVRAVKGSREPFHARMVPYFDSTDHHSFTPRHVGVPGTSLTNWPDQWIHSSGDDLENIDATQLERNAVVVAAVALYFADAHRRRGARPRRLHGRSRPGPGRRRHRDRGRPPRPRRREGATGGLGGLGGPGAPDPRPGGAGPHLARPHGPEGAVPRRRLGRPAGARALAGVGAAGPRAGLRRAHRQQPTPRRRRRHRARRWPGWSTSRSDDARRLSRDLEKVKGPATLHALMTFETLNFSDGTRTAWEVYEAVAAEALSAGAWYYGTVRPADVKAVLDSAVEVGVYTRKER